jgi:hypothetical protein
MTCSIPADRSNGASCTEGGTLKRFGPLELEPLRGRFEV